MTVKNIIDQMELLYGRKSHKYVIQLINDALLDIGSTKQHLLEDVKMDLVEDKRWYELEDNMIDITRVEVKDTNGRYVMIPKLADSHKLLKGDDF